MPYLPEQGLTTTEGKPAKGKAKGGKRCVHKTRLGTVSNKAAPATEGGSSSSSSGAAVKGSTTDAGAGDLTPSAEAEGSLPPADASAVTPVDPSTLSSEVPPVPDIVEERITREQRLREVAKSKDHHIYHFPRTHTVPYVWVPMCHKSGSTASHLTIRNELTSSVI